jgi:site-specific DNA recombinase
MTPQITRRAVIYCRVSDKNQKNNGDGLQSQEHRCRNYAAARGYAVEAVFHDDASGAGDFMKRPGVVALLGFLEQHPDGYIVVFDDLKRFARDTLFHLRLRQALGTFRAVVECLNFNFEDTPEGQFVETVFAAQGELERLQNRRQVVQKMKARVERGYYVFAPPVGYRYEKVDPHGAPLVRDEPLAGIVTEALEGYATERFGMAAEVKRWLEAQPHFPKAAGRVRQQEVTRLLTRCVYAGYVEGAEVGGRASTGSS